MKKILGTFFWAPRLGVGAALLAFCAFTPVSSRALETIVDNLPGAGYTPTGANPDNIIYFGQVFTMSGSSGNLDSVTLCLDFTVADSASVYLYATSAGAPTGAGTLLGTVSSGIVVNNGLFTISGLNNSLTASTDYAIVLGPSGGGNNDIYWNLISPPAGSVGSGSLGGAFFSFDGSTAWTTSGSLNYQMQVTAVPEVPMTGAVMGIGALAIAIGRNLRRKIPTTA